MAEKHTGRKIVFFLGAGASVGAGAVARVQAGGSVRIPTQSDFWDVFLRFSRGRTNRKAIERFLFRYFLGYAKVPSRLRSSGRRGLFAGVDVEEVFTFLSERVRAPSTSAQLRSYVAGVWASLVDEIGNVFSRFDANAATKSAYREMFNNHIRSRDAVVSFNYDDVFERSLSGPRRWAYEGLEDCRGRLRIIKPHGSVGWKEIDKTVQKGKRSDAVIVAPTHLKFVATGDGASPILHGYLDQSPQFGQIWAAMEDQMRQAKALVFIGYSFPVADLYFSSLLRSVLADRAQAPGLVLVNPDAVAISQRLKARFAISDPVRLFDLRQFIGMTRQQILGLFD
jgi:hypothetical protein